MMKKELAIFFAAIIVLNILAVSVLADDGASASANASVSTSSDSGDSQASAGVSAGVGLASPGDLRQQVQDMRQQVAEDRQQIRNQTEQFIQEREQFRNETQDIRENISAMIEARQEMMNQFREKLREQDGEWRVGNQTVMINLSDQQKEIIAEGINARTGLNLTAGDIGNGTLGQDLRAILSNGRFADIRVMPNVAAKVALERLQARCYGNCSVELKQVGSGNETKAAYVLQTEKRARLLGFIPVFMNVQAQVDSTDGVVLSVNKPWWSFLASEDNANQTAIDNSIGSSESNSSANVSVSENSSVSVNDSTSTNVSDNASADVNANVSVTAHVTLNASA